MILSHVRCIVFDAVGTLIYPDPPVAEVYASVGRKHGSRLSVAEVGERFAAAFRAEYALASPSNEAEERRLWRRIVERVFAPEKREACFEELFAHFGKAASWRIFPDVKETLSELTRRGYSLGVASNFDRRLHAILEGHAELARLFPRVISSEVGFQKSNAAFYRELADQANFTSQEILMVGDDWENDVMAAREAGMSAVYLDRSGSRNASADAPVSLISTLTELPGLLS